MKKEEFPTFLNEQPTVIFGRTTRELLIIACGCAGSYVIWNNTRVLLPGPGGIALGVACAIAPALLSIVIALISIGNRPLEEWFLCWLTYTFMPRIYLYKPLEESMDDFADKKKKDARQHRSDTDGTADIIDED